MNETFQVDWNVGEVPLRVPHVKGAQLGECWQGTDLQIAKCFSCDFIYDKSGAVFRTNVRSVMYLPTVSISVTLTSIVNCF